MTDQRSPFSHKVRVRSCGLLVKDDHILLAKIHSPVINKLIWTPPGGGVEFGETLMACLKREFAEETNVTISIGNLIHCNELIESSFHALEFYFEVNQLEGEIELGTDPELSGEEQLLKEVRWIPINKLQDYEFAPYSLLEPLMDWEHRSVFGSLSMQNLNKE